MALPEIYVSTDIETDGWRPGRNSVLSLGSAAFLADKTLLATFSVNLLTLPEGQQEPYTMQWWETQPQAWAACRQNCVSPEEGIKNYVQWLKQLPGKPIFVGFPAVFDFGFVQYYLHRFAGENPFGFAVIDIRSYAMSLQRTTFMQAAKHHLPVHWLENRPHTHIALDDALEQGTLFCNMLLENKTRESETSFKPYLKKISQGNHLNTEEAYAALQAMCSLETHKTQRAAFLAMLSLRQETPEELAGFLTFLKDQTTHIPFDQQALVIDIVGTGGDALKTFNISTAASLVVASTGINVAKHGGRSVTSQSGSADVLEALHIPLSNNSESIAKQLTDDHFAFLFAPFFNPMLKEFSSLRKELGIRTFFNLLAPLANPMNIKRQVVGVYNAALLPTLIEALKVSGSTHAMVVHSMDGMDELSVSNATHIAHLKNKEINYYTLTPEEVGLSRYDIREVEGGNALINGAIIQDIFSGKERGARRDIVLLNAAAGFIVADKVTTFKDGIDLAAQAIDSGACLELLTRLGASPIPSPPRSGGRGLGRGDKYYKMRNPCLIF